MKKAFPRILAIAMALCLILGMVPAFAQAEKTQIYFLMNESDDVMRNWVSATKDTWLQDFPNVDLKFEFSAGSASEYETKIRTMVSAGNAPDIWWSHGASWSRPLIAAGELLQLDQYLDKLDFWNKYVIPSAKVASAYDGHYYAFPFESLLYNIVLYNKATFAKYNLTPPKTMDEFFKIVQTLIDNKETPFVTGASGGWPVAAILEGFAYSQDPEATKKVIEGKAKFTDQPYTYAATQLKKMMDMGAFTSDVALVSNDEAETIFKSGSVAMWPIYSYALSNAYPEMKDNLGWFFYPASDESGIADIGTSLAGGVKVDSGLVCSASTKNPELTASVAAAIARSYSKYYFEVLGDPVIPYNAEANGWTFTGTRAPVIEEFSGATKNFKNVYGFVQDVLPTAAANTALLSACTEFMTGSLEIPDFLEQLNQALTAE
jgi:raffinose/stachyose/melibiose transport system substrate-binding protein